MRVKINDPSIYVIRLFIVMGNDFHTNRPKKLKRFYKIKYVAKRNEVAECRIKELIINQAKLLS